MDAFVGEIRAFGFSFTPMGWLPCDGTVYSVAPYQALASLLGATFGGDGRNTFGVPDLRARIPFGSGTSSYGKVCQYGRPDGGSTTTLQANQMPVHTHQATFTPAGAQPLTVSIAVANAPANQGSPNGNYLAQSGGGVEMYAPVGTTPVVALGGVAVQTTAAAGTVTVTPSGSPAPAPVDLRPSHVAMRFFICVKGLYPTRP